MLEEENRLALAAGIHLDDTCPEFLRESSKICVVISYVVTVHETFRCSGFRLADGHVKKSRRAVAPALLLFFCTRLKIL